MRFYYNETDDADALVVNLTFHDVELMIQEHNEYFGTEYKSIQEFNDGEEYREFVAMSKAGAVHAYLEENGYSAMIIGDLVWVTIWTEDLECSMQVMVDLEDPKFNEAYDYTKNITP
jgi:hypothetical protein